MSQPPIVIPCPNCGAPAEVETIDVGVGLYFNPDGYVCSRCDWQEGNEVDYRIGQLTMDERPCVPLALEPLVSN